MAPSFASGGDIPQGATLWRPGRRQKPGTPLICARAISWVWSVAGHLADKPKDVVDLYKRFGLLKTRGPYTVSVTKTATVQRNPPGVRWCKAPQASLEAFLDLQREVHDEGFLRTSLYTKSLYVHQFWITSAAQLDDSFAALIEEAYQVGLDAHRGPRNVG